MPSPADGGRGATLGAPGQWAQGAHRPVEHMGADLAGVVLAAGAGRRLAPLTYLRPKPLCPVGGRPLVDHALDRLSSSTGDVAVNLHHGAGVLDAYLPRAVHRSHEQPVALGTAGALGALRDWIAGRAVLVTNADAWLGPDLDVGAFVDGWDGERVRLLTVEDPARGDFGSRRYCGVALLPWRTVRPLAAEPAGLYEVSWAAEAAAGRLDLVAHGGPFVDCGTPADYLAANLAATGGGSAVDARATVGEGAVVEQSVVWDGAEVRPGEHLWRAVRAGHLTVLVR